ncbi:30S ribosomal protein S20 [Fimbriiglobus ruber]|uniref:Small ribosomal subunit protein bS20 n=1 Tax=Fimbriiglobus ruber TaxID=1908690 RepID=A0A225E1F6_9BACT|nr:30S ribosomal protein S20 [Fimbriiglobus ruber]OWK43846.1 SSU ribosomal protein S20p [Fimbriiglobus ruber]
MPHTKSAWKRLRSSELRRRRNRTTVKGIKLQTREAAEALASGDATKATPAFQATVSKLDKAAARGVIHKNKAARLKSKLAKKLNNLKPKPAEAPKS